MQKAKLLNSVIILEDYISKLTLHVCENTSHSDRATNISRQLWPEVEIWIPKLEEGNMFQLQQGKARRGGTSILM
jgi:hypothetical protein